MADTIKNNIKLAIMEEVTEGTYLTPSSAAAFISPLSDGLELTPVKELLERSNLNSSIGKSKPRGGMRSVSASISVEAKAHGTAGSAPEYGPLVKAALGTSRSNTTVVTSKATGNTATVLQIEDADISKFLVGDIVLVKQSGAYHVSPVITVASGAGVAAITLLVAHPSGDMTDSVTIEKFITYLTANSGHKSISISKYVESARREYAAGCKVTSLNLNNFTTGQLADFSFSLDGMSFDHSLTAPSYTPSLNSALPPIVLGACVYVDGVKVPVNEVTLSVENSLAWKTSTCSEDGRIASRIASRSVTGSFNPYKQDDSVANFTKFDLETQFSLFGFMAVPTSTVGEVEDVVGFYMPNCMITEYTEADADGLLQENLSFSANRGITGETEELYITFI